MRVYIASAFSNIADVRVKRDELKAIGIDCTSTWADETADPNIQMTDKSLTDSFLLYTAITDIKDIDRSDAIVLITQEPTKPFVRGGRMHEFGYAMGRGKKLFVCGPRENIFHYLPTVTVCADFEETKQALLKYQLELEKAYSYGAGTASGRIQTFGPNTVYNI